MNRYELTDSSGDRLSLITDSASVVLQNGRTLADYEPVHKLLAITHFLDAYPYVMLLYMSEGKSTTLIPAGVEYPSRDEVIVYSARNNWGGTPNLHKIHDREYTVTFEENKNDSLYIRLI